MTDHKTRHDAAQTVFENWDSTDGLDEGDLDLIRSMLERTPTERLREIQGVVDAAKALRSRRRG